MSDSSTICLSCGLCCDGSLIGFVQLEASEVPALRKEIAIEEAHQENIFFHPCDRYCNGCTIYAERPINCGKFKCGLLKNVEENKVSFSSAITTIESLKKKRTALEEHVTALSLQLQSQSFYFKMAEIDKILETEQDEAHRIRSRKKMMTDFKELEVLITTKFELSFP